MHSLAARRGTNFLRTLQEFCFLVLHYEVNFDLTKFTKSQFYCWDERMMVKGM